MSVNTDFSLPLYGDPLTFVLATKGDFGHSWDKFLSEEEVGSAAFQLPAGRPCARDLVPSPSDSSSVRRGTKNFRGWDGSDRGPCQADKLLGSVCPLSKHQVMQDSKCL